MKKNYKKVLKILFIFTLIFSIIGIKNVLANEPMLILENVVISDKSEKVDATIVSFNDNELNTDVTFHKINDFVSYILTIKNTTDKEYQVKLISDNNSNNNVEYEYSYDNSGTISPNGQLNVSLKATYKNSVTDMTKRIQTKEFSLIFAIEDEDGNITNDEIIINPKTNDNIYFYIVIGTISLIGLVLLFVKNKKVKKSFVILLLISPVVTKAIKPSFVINLNPTLKLYDKLVVTRIVNGEEVEEIVDYESLLEIPEDLNILGYNFEGWLLDGEPFDSDKEIKEDSVLEAILSPIEYNITYDLDDGVVDGTNKTKYTIETDSFDLINPSKEGYVFAGWTGSNGENLQTRVTVEKGTTDNLHFVAHFTPGEHTPYKVIHRYKKLTDGYDIEEEELEGVTKQKVTPAFRPKEGFDNPENQEELEILPNGSASVTYTYERKMFDVVFSGDTNTYETNIEAGSYPYGTTITLTALEQEHFNFVKWSNNSTDNPLTITLSSNLEIEPVFEAKEYTISFNSHDGVDVGSITKEYNTELGNLPETTKDDYVFGGWYTNDEYTTQVTESTKVTGNMTLHAKWLKSITLAVVNPESITLTRGNQQALTLTNVEEEYTFASKNESIATVTNAGVVIGVLKGTTKIEITGVSSHEKIEVDVTVNPIYYTVEFDGHNNTSIPSVSVEENTVATLPNISKTNNLFDGWYTTEEYTTQVTNETTVTENTTYHAKWTPTINAATILPNPLEISSDGTGNISINGPTGMESYTIVSLNQQYATVTNDGVVTGVAAGSATIKIIGSRSLIEKTITVNVIQAKATITFDTHGGVAVDSIEVDKNSTLDAIPTTTKDNLVFMGWYTLEEGGGKLTTETVITSDITYHAHWSPFVCKQATTLHRETCNRTGSDGCRAGNAYASGALVTFGNTTMGANPSAGDAYDCDVNGDGVYDSNTERFYYLRTDDNDKAVLIYYSNVTNGVANTANSYAYSSTNHNYDIPTVLLSHLPSKSQWNNTNIENPKHNILDEHGEEIQNNNNQTVEIDYTNYSARLITVADINEACNITISGSSTISINNCKYLLENSTYTYVSGGNVKSGYWIEGGMSTNTYKSFRVNGSGRVVGYTDSNNTTGSGVRPVIEVPIILVEKGEKEIVEYAITLNANGGTVTPTSKIIAAGSKIGTLPTPEKENNLFDGWYTLPTGGELVTENTEPSSSTVYFARWTPTIESATITPESLTLTEGNTGNINISGPTGMEDYTIVSSNESYVTVTNEGVVTAVAEGTTTIKITGARSAVERSISVTVNAVVPNEYEVSFNTHEGTAVDSMQIEEGGVINPLPETTKDGYIFDGWYTAETGGTKLTTTTPITATITYHAHWLKSVTLATVSPESVEVTVGSSQELTITNVDEEYTISSNDESKATVEGNVVTGVGEGSTTLTIYGTTSELTKTVNVTVNEAVVNIYTISFNTHGGEAVDSITREENEEIGDLPKTTQDGVFFGGWYTEEDGGTQVTSETVVTSGMTLHAHWNAYLCYPAENLHTATCGTQGGCLSAGFSNGSLITYGKKPNSTTLSPGFAYDCDVDGDGILDEDNERFYYLRTIDGDAVLTYHSNFEGEDGKKNENIFVYTLALTKLPTTTQWSNVVKTFDGKAARLPLLGDVQAACGEGTPTNTGYLNSCYYLMENTRFVSNTTGRSGIWLVNEDNQYNRIHTKNRLVESRASEATSSQNGVRPTIEVPIEYIKEFVSTSQVFTVSFDTDGGVPVDDMQIEDGGVISPLPTTSKDNYEFEGWYLDTGYQTQFTTSTPVTESITLHAKMTPHVATVNGVGYTTLENAISHVPNNTETHVVIIRNTTVSSKITIPSNKNIILDIGEYTITTNDTLFDNKGTLSIGSGTITCSAGSGAINNLSGGTLNVTGVSIIATGTRQAVYNDGGTLNISGDAYLENVSSERATVQNTNKNGTVTITGGTIVSKNQQAVKNEATQNNKIIIGTQNGVYDATTPILQGATYGLTTSYNISIYDGILKGVTGAVDNQGKLANLETGAVKQTSTETIGQSTYNTLYYTIELNEYVITFDPGDGTVSPTSKTVQEGHAIGELPIPENGVYHFDGWYTNTDYNVEVTEETVLTGNVTYVAKWSYISSTTPVNFNMDNDPMTVYYNNINEWKNDKSFATVMLENFNNYNCSKCEGTNSCNSPQAGTYCDKPKGYNTGINDTLNVYLYDTVNNERGSQVTYTTSTNGTIYNMIPGKTYYWESSTNSDIYGVVTANGTRRIIESGSSVRNVRDLGGLEVSFVRNDETKTGTIKYGKLFRGAKLGTGTNGTADVASLTKLGVTREIDLRAASEGSGQERLTVLDITASDNPLLYSTAEDVVITNYIINPTTTAYFTTAYPDNYRDFKKYMKAIMRYVAYGDDSIYFHCTIGTDRTGTMAYFLEGLLGVGEEDRLQDYELTYFFGLTNRTRFHDNLSGSDINPRFYSMYRSYPDYQSIYDFYTFEREADDDTLLEDFRDAMIDYN